jgi:hypothetical protein
MRIVTLAFRIDVPACTLNVKGTWYAPDGSPRNTVGTRSSATVVAGPNVFPVAGLADNTDGVVLIVDG